MIGCFCWSGKKSKLGWQIKKSFSPHFRHSRASGNPSRRRRDCLRGSDGFLDFLRSHQISV